jgi:hypothetical protein
MVISIDGYSVGKLGRLAQSRSDVSDFDRLELSEPGLPGSGGNRVSRRIRGKSEN